MLLETLHQRRKRGVVVVVLHRLVAHLRLEVRAVSLQREAADYDRGMMQNMLLLASIGLFAVAIYCSRPPTPTAVPDPDPEDLGLSILPRALLAGDDDTHWSERPKPDHAKMRSLLAETRAVAAAAEEEKHERLAGAIAAEAQHVTVRRTPATAEGELLVDGGVAAEGDAVGLPCVRLLQAATAALLEETQAEVDKQHEVTIRGAGEWAACTSSRRGAFWMIGRSCMRLTISSTPRRRTVAGNSTSRATPWHRQRCFGHVTVRRTPATAEGELLVDGGVAAEGDAVGLPCVRLLQAATAALLEETQAEVDKQHEVTIRGAGEWAACTSSRRGAFWMIGRSCMRLTISSTPRRRTVAGNSTSRATPWHRQRCFGRTGQWTAVRWIPIGIRAATSVRDAGAGRGCEGVAVGGESAGGSRREVSSDGCY